MGISLYENRSYAYNIMHAAILAEKADSFDIIHSHIEHVFCLLSKKSKPRLFQQYTVRILIAPPKTFLGRTMGNSTLLLCPNPQLNI